ncbi:hypothetical protein BLA18628_07198 [Burkholderia aenigmatica]|uniref:hypothetical protein n=1 Tax=Burkholderia aenigmatica TaxID=2015348 RepID=UPI0014530A44|nr:hypothetical protein [Burkholderia aenigmatica]VWD60891.1 hypothetical protein BLA18628_07198 [Burkholderia aenigmatica]
MDELNAAPSSTEPPSDATSTVQQALDTAAAMAQEAGTAAEGEQSNASGDTSASDANDTVDAPTIDAPEVAASGESQPSTSADSQSSSGEKAVGGGVDTPSHLLMLDVMLAEIERKIAAGIHLFAHEVTAARDHLAKLL